MRFLGLVAALAVMGGPAQAALVTANISLNGFARDANSNETDVGGSGSVIFYDTPVDLGAWCLCDLQAYFVKSLDSDIASIMSTTSISSDGAPSGYYLGLGDYYGMVLSLNVGRYGGLDSYWEFWNYFANEGFYLGSYRFEGPVRPLETPLPAAGWIMLAGIAGLYSAGKRNT